jgi:hypothetical protein
MAFQVVRCRMQGKTIVERSVVGTEPTTPAAEELARSAAARSAESGFDPDHGFWWGRSADGTELRYFVEVADGDGEDDE